MRIATPMKILIAIGVPRQKEAGAAGVVLNHARELVKRGHSVDCWFLDDLIARQVHPKRIEALIFSQRVASRIFREREKYDVVNLHAPWGCVYGMRRRTFDSAKVPPYVMTMQGSEARCSEMMLQEHKKGRCAHFALHNRLWHRVYHQTMYRYSIRTAGFGAIANREGAAWAQAVSDGAAAKFKFVPNGVEECFFTPREYPEKPILKLLYTGSWLDRKGIHYLSEAFHTLARKSQGVTLTIAGCLTSEEDVKRFFALDVRDRVEILRFIERARMPEIYSSHDIFVLPSLMEGMPLTLLEAMASGMPVVTTNICGMADVVEDGRNGLLVPPADAEHLAHAIERLCQASNLRRELGQAAQNAMRCYTWENVTRGLEELLILAVQQGARN